MTTIDPDNTSAEHESTETPAGTPRRPKRGLWIAISVVAAAVLAAAGIAIFASAASRSPFESAVEECDLEGSPYIRIGDDGDTLLVDTEGDESEGARFGDTACVLISLDVPDSMVARMDSTRALDGVQQDTFDGIDAQWSYHPNNGLDIIFTR